MDILTCLFPSFPPPPALPGTSICLKTLAQISYMECLGLLWNGDWLLLVLLYQASKINIYWVNKCMIDWMPLPLMTALPVLVANARCDYRAWETCLWEWAGLWMTTECFHMYWELWNLTHLCFLELFQWQPQRNEKPLYFILFFGWQRKGLSSPWTPEEERFNVS